VFCLSSKQAALLGRGVLLTRVSWQHAYPLSVQQALGSAALVTLTDAVGGSSGGLPFVAQVSTGRVPKNLGLWVGALHACPPLPTTWMYRVNSVSLEKATWTCRLLVSFTSMKGEGCAMQPTMCSHGASCSMHSRRACKGCVLLGDGAVLGCFMVTAFLSFQTDIPIDQGRHC